ncbi:hypothetical protein [Tychonema sp. LEGE 06208]|uniref:hypothetical protein n=1 Tax=Tychonema sp. LEGE 06208 TaxID=1828663 RepID=UPI0030D8090B
MWGRLGDRSEVWRCCRILCKARTIDRDLVCTQYPPELCSPQLNRRIAGLRIAVADGYFATEAEPQAMDAVEIVAKALTNTLRCGIQAE